jgi:hypothetical protein
MIARRLLSYCWDRWLLALRVHLLVVHGRLLLETGRATNNRGDRIGHGEEQTPIHGHLAGTTPTGLTVLITRVIAETAMTMMEILHRTQVNNAEFGHYAGLRGLGKKHIHVAYHGQFCRSSSSGLSSEMMPAVGSSWLS